MSKVSPWFLFSACVLLAPFLAPAEPAVVGLARAYLGPDSTLDGIKSIHYVGTLDRVDPDHPGAEGSHTTLDLIFVKPLRQRLVVRATNASMTTVLDGYDAWDWLQSNSDASKFRLTWLTAADIKTLRANTWENLYYYRSPEGGSVDDMGPSTIDGVECERVDFSHGPELVYQRYFDRDTGRLVLTVRGAESFRESGEIRVDGVRFPRKIVSVTKTRTGKDLVSTATFESIVLNETLGNDLFTVPSTVRQRPAAPAAVQPFAAAAK
jgi:hypothetical protein